MASTADAATAEAVRVLVRVRPLSGTETASGAQPCVDVDGVANHITVKGREKLTFDNVADEASTQVSVYEATAAPLLEQAAKGFNGSIIAYGQTGSGKTHTMGTADLSSEITEMSGVIPRLSHDIFEMAKRDGAHTCTEIKVSFLEIYNEEIIDLLAPKESRGEKLAVRGDKNVEVVGLTHAVVGTVGEMQVKLQQVRSDRIAECGVGSGNCGYGAVGDWSRAGSCAGGARAVGRRVWEEHGKGGGAGRGVYGMAGASEGDGGGGGRSEGGRNWQKWWGVG
jgi:hypothetical protein